MFAMRSYVFGLAVSVAIALPVAAQTGEVAAASGPGKVGVAQTVTITATITAIDKATRDITLKGPQGNEMTVTAGQKVKNFNKLKVGDQINAKYVEALTLQLVKGGGQQVARTEDTADAPANTRAQPAGAVGRQVTVVADVIGLDSVKQTVTLKGPERTVELAVKDPEQFKLISVGDQVKATYTQALALAIEPVKK